MKTETEEPLSFRTNLRSLPEITSQVLYQGGDPRATKKAARKEISVRATSESLGFLHSILVAVKGKYFLVAGPSGIGKTTFANNLGIINESVLANDWVAIEKEDDRFYASDLNFSEGFRNRERCPVSGVIFLTRDDQFKRDSFSPNAQELEDLLRETFDTASVEEANQLSLFWTSNKDRLPCLCAVPARRGSGEVIARTLLNLIRRAEISTQPLDVGVVGIGSVGAELTSQLGSMPQVRKVHIFNRSPGKAIGNALDINQALIGKGGEVVVAEDSVEDVFSAASSVFIALRDDSSQSALAHMSERWQKLHCHIGAISNLADIISTRGFEGTIFTITNPSDFLTYALYQQTQGQPTSLRTYQVYGMGLELDAMRALYFAKKMNPKVTSSSISIYGNHTDEYTIQSELSVEEGALLLQQVRHASNQIRTFVPRTVYGPVGSIVRAYKAFLTGGETHITTIQQDAFVGRRLGFRNQLPTLTEDISDPKYAGYLENNRSRITAYLQRH